MAGTLAVLPIYLGPFLLPHIMHRLATGLEFRCPISSGTLTMCDHYMALPLLLDDIRSGEFLGHS